MKGLTALKTQLQQEGVYNPHKKNIPEAKTSSDLEDCVTEPNQTPSP